VSVDKGKSLVLSYNEAKWKETFR